MAAVVHGTAHIYGIVNGVGGIVNATVLSDSITETTINNGETINELGNKIEDRRDDVQLSGSVTLRIRTSYSVAKAATKLAYNYDGVGSKDFLITEVARAATSSGFVEITYNVLWNESCSYSTPTT